MIIVRELRQAVVWLFASIAVAFAGCEQYGATYPTDVSERTLAIHGLLLANEPEQEILIEYVRPLGEGYYPGGLTPARVAEAAVEREDGARFPFLEVADTPGVFRASFTPRSGERYTLRVRDVDGTVATGTTVIPGTPILLEPGRDTVVAAAPNSQLDVAWVPLIWTAASSAGYVVSYRLPGRPLRYHGLWLQSATIQQDTTAAAPVGSILLFPYGADLGIAAVDSVYAAFVADEPWQVVWMSRARSTLQGAYGIFASAALSEFRRVEIAR